jgi:hypothetical protein
MTEPSTYYTPIALLAGALAHAKLPPVTVSEITVLQAFLPKVMVTRLDNKSKPRFELTPCGGALLVKTRKVT